MLPEATSTTRMNFHWLKSFIRANVGLFIHSVHFIMLYGMENVAVISFARGDAFTIYTSTYSQPDD